MKAWLPPRHTPQWLRNRPRWWAGSLSTYNRVQRAFAPEQRTRTLLTLVALTVLIVAALAGLAARHVISLLQLGADNWLITTMLVTLHSGFTVLKPRPGRHSSLPYEWLPPEIQSTHSVQRVAWRRGSLRAVLIWSLACVVVWALAALANAAAPLTLAAISALTLGTAAGIVLGVWVARRRGNEDMPESRYVVHRRSKAIAEPSTHALSRLPTAQLRAWARPENSKLLVLVALATVPGGVTAWHGLIVLAMWLVGAYLSGLLTAVMHAATVAARWLRSCPIGFWQFAWIVSRRALAHQLVGTTFGAVVMLSLGGPPDMVVYFCALWLLIVGVAAAVSLAQAFRSKESRLAFVGSLVALVALEIKQKDAAFVVGAMLAALHVRAAIHHRVV